MVLLEAASSGHPVFLGMGEACGGVCSYAVLFTDVHIGAVKKREAFSQGQIFGFIQVPLMFTAELLLLCSVEC